MFYYNFVLIPVSAYIFLNFFGCHNMMLIATNQSIRYVLWSLCSGWGQVSVSVSWSLIFFFSLWPKQGTHCMFCFCCLQVRRWYQFIRYLIAMGCVTSVFLCLFTYRLNLYNLNVTVCVELLSYPLLARYISLTLSQFVFLMITL
jgi:hypothetical protein